VADPSDEAVGGRTGMKRSSVAQSGRKVVICTWRRTDATEDDAAEAYCLQVAEWMQTEGMDVTLVTPRRRGEPRREVGPHGRRVRLGGPLSSYLLIPLWLLWNRDRIDGVLDSANGIPYFSPLVLPSATPVVLLIQHVRQEQFTMQMNAGAAWVCRRLERDVARKVYGQRPVCAVSPSARSDVRRRLAFRGPLFVAPSGVEVPNDLPGKRSPAPVIACVGRVVSSKRFDLLLRALPSLLDTWPNLTVEIIGDGKARPGLEGLARRIGVGANVRFHGKVQPAVRDDLLASAWFTVNPSMGEGWGLSVIEAAALGIPAVAFKVPGLRDAVRPGTTGWLVEKPGDLAAALADALKELQDPAAGASYAEACREWAATFTWEATAERILMVLASEDDRLQQPGADRRRTNDSATVVEFPQPVVTPELVGRLRRSDQIRVSEGRVELLLTSADEHDAAAALRRLGLPTTLRKQGRVARHFDLLGWLPRSAAHDLSGPMVDTAARAEGSWVELEEANGRVIELRPRTVDSQADDGAASVEEG
jgi:glycosyltransferase involved in cell wall biosynthesis